MKNCSVVLVVLAAMMQLAGCAAPVIAVGGAAAIGAVQDRRTSGTMIDDDSISAAVQRTLTERYGENTHVNVNSFNRALLLTGEVPDQARREEIEKIAREIPNVRGVTNDLQLKPPSTFGARSNDTFITTRVKGRLLDAVKVNPLHVKVVTEGSVVYLMGLVTEQEADAAVEVARTTGGVLKVVKVFEYCKAGDGVCGP